MTGTGDGSLEWDDSYGGYQTALGGQTLVLERNPLFAPTPRTFVEAVKADDPDSEPLGLPGAAVLEIRGKKGEVLERIEPLNPLLLQGVLDRAREQQSGWHSATVTDAVSRLYDLVVSRKEALADAAINDVLGALEGLVRAK